MGRVWTSQTIIGRAPLDAATTAWVNAVLGNGGSVSDSRMTLVDNFILGGKQDGWWTKFDRIWLHAGENQPSALTDLVGRSLATAVNSPTFTIDRGYTGQDANSPTTIYIDSNFNAFTGTPVIAQIAGHVSAWSVTNTTVVNGGCLIGITNGSNTDTSLYDTFTDGNIYARINDNPSSGSQGAPGTAIGHWLINRSSGGATTQLYQNASLFSSPNGTSAAFPNGTFAILAQRNTTTTIVRGSPQQIAMSSIGGNLSSTDVANFYGRLRTYMTAVGVP